MNAVAYLRVSGQSQLEGTGFDRQLEFCAHLAQSKEFTITRTFREEAISGTLDETERPAFREMVAYMLDSGTKIILIEGMHRLARAMMIQEQLLLYIAAKDLTLYAADTGENITEAMLENPMKKAMIQIQGVFAELDKSMIVAKLKKGRQRTKEKVGRSKLREMGLDDEDITAVMAKTHGRCEGQKPFGHYPGEGVALTQILACRNAGFTCQGTADHLNSRHIPTRSGGLWRSATIAKILRREAAAPVLRPSCAIPSGELPLIAASESSYGV